MAVPEGDPVISFRLQFSLNDPQQRRWPLVPLSVGPDIVLDMLPNLLASRSAISRRSLADMRGRGLIAGDEPPIVLRELRIVGQPVPDVAVRVGSAPNLLDVDGFLGFDLVAKCSRIVFEPETLTMTLIDP